MIQSYLSGLMVVLWMMTGKLDNTAVKGGEFLFADHFSQSVTEPSDNFNAARILAPCDPPTAVAVGSITTTTASVSFTSLGTNFVVEYGPIGFIPGTGASAGTNGTVVTGAASPVGLSGLTDGTTYEVYVRNDCGVDGFSVNAGPVLFNTTCGGPTTVPYLERFDEVIAPAVPACVTVENTNGGNTWRTVGNDFSASARNIMRIDWELDGTTAADDWFFTKGITLTGGTSYRLRFLYRNSDSTDYIEKLEVKYGTGANSASMTLGTLFSNTNIINKNFWWEGGSDFTPSTTGVYYIGFHGFSDADQAFLCVDNINVIETPACEPPTAVYINNINSTLATVNFTAAPGNFIIEYGPVGFTPGIGASAGGGTIVNTNTSPFTITGLNPSVLYDLYVRRDCGAGSFSPNSLVVSFTTHLVNDDAPGAIAVTVGAGCTGNAYTNLGATQSGSEPFASCTGAEGYNTVWYKFVAPIGGAVKISNDFAGAGLGDSRLAVFSATNVNDYSTFSILGCDDDNGVVVTDKSILYITGLNPGVTYYIQVDGHNSATAQGSFCLEVSSLTSSMLAGTAACGNSQSFSNLNTSYRGWISLVDNSGNLIANIKQTAGTATNVGASINVNALSVRQDAVSLQYYLDRNYKIDATGATEGEVQFFFLDSELSALNNVDAFVSVSNLGVTRQTGNSCQADFISSNGTNSYLLQTGNGSLNGVGWINVNTSVFSNFYLHTNKAPVVLKTFLQGAYNASASQHKNITTTWAGIMNTNALNQPYSAAPFSYGGTEHVSPGFFVASSSPTAVLDWVLIELRDASNVLVKQRAAFILINGRIVDIDGTSNVEFRNIPSGNYYIRIRHRNHLGIRTPATQGIDGSLGSNPSTALYDFSTAQSQAFQNGTIATNAAMALNGSVYMMWAGNANGDDFVRAITQLLPPMPSDPANILSTVLGGNPNATFAGYSRGDINMDGNTRVTLQLLPPIASDAAFLLSTSLSGNPNGTRREHK